MVEKTEDSQAVPNSVPKVICHRAVKTSILGSKALALNHASQQLVSGYLLTMQHRQGTLWGVCVVGGLRKSLRCTCHQAPLNTVSDEAGLSQVGTGF